VHGSYTKSIDPVYIVTDGERPATTTTSSPMGVDTIYSTPTYGDTPQQTRRTPEHRFMTPTNYPPYLDPMRPKETQTKEDFLD